MTDEKIFAVIALYEQELPLVIEDSEDEPWAHSIEHVVNTMLPQMRQFVVDARREKLMRWLGFVQGVLFTTNVYTLEELKAHNREDS